MSRVNEIKDSNVFGSHCVIEPAGALPQPVEKINNDVSFFRDKEILVDVGMIELCF